MNEGIYKILKDRYFLSTEDSWEELSERVGKLYKPITDYIKNMEFIPSTPTLMNANTGGKRRGTLSSCFPMGIEDSMEGILESVKECGLVTKAGGGIGINFSNLRSSEEIVKGADGRKSSGVMAFIGIFNEILDGIFQGSARRGAGMSILSIDHPDILSFIDAKKDLTKYNRFNFSISVPDWFYERLEKNPDSLHCVYHLTTGEYKEIDITVKELWDKIIENAWEMAEPGVYNIDIARKRSAVTNITDEVIPNPCLRDSVKVLKEEGLVDLKDLKIGDYIWSSEGWTEVVNKFRTGIKEVFEYTTTAGIFESTSNHEVLSNGLKIPVNNAKKIDVLTGNYFSRKEIYPNFIMDGLVLGDGSIHKASNDLIYLYIGKDDQDYFDSEIKDLLLKDRDKAFKMGWEIETKIQKEDLVATYKRKIPERYFSCNRDELFSLLRGLYSANGSIVGNRVSYKSASFNMILNIQLILSSLGIRSYYTTNKAKKNRFRNGDYLCKQSYDLNISGDINKFYESIGFLQKYKMNKLKTILDNKKNNSRVQKKSFDIKKKESIGFHEVWDITVDNKSHTFWCEGFNISNCSEFTSIPYSSCNLGSINISELVKEDKSFDHERFGEIIENAVVFLNKVIDKNDFPLKKIEKVTKDIRPIGLGIMGLAHALFKMNMPYNNEWSLIFIEDLFFYLTLKSIQVSVELAKKDGAYPAFDYDTFMKANKRFLEKNKYVDIDVKQLREDIKKYGIRNSGLTSIAPCGSISTLSQTSSGIEPVFALTYQRRVEQVNKEYDVLFITDTVFEEYLDKNFDEKVKIKILENVSKNKGSCQNCKEIPEEMKKVFITAGDLSPMEHLNVLEKVANNVTYSVSKTINLPMNASKEEVSEVYLEAFKKGIVGVTVYRDGCREGILVYNDTGKDDDYIIERSAPKRPKSVPCHVYRITVHGDKWIGFVGLYKEHPYEVFAGKVDLVDIPSYITEGFITKIKSGVYQFEYEGEVIIKDIRKLFDSGVQEALTRQISTNLRHGTPVEYVQEQLLKSHGSIVDFNKTISRTLKRYMKERASKETCPTCGAEMRYIDGCVSCENPECDFSKCG